MAIYSIRTTRKQEIGLKYTYDTHADKTQFPTQESYFQYRIDKQVSDLMYAEQQRATLIAFDQSFNTIPETEQPAAKTEIETVITTHGGTIVPVSPPEPNPVGFPIPVVPPPPPPPPGPPSLGRGGDV